MRAVLVTVAFAACVDREVTQVPPCQARIAYYDFGVAFDERERGCLEPPQQCYGRIYDADWYTLGTQYACDVSDVQHFGLADEAEQVLPQCDDAAANLPCWRQVTDETCREHAAIEIVRGGIPAPAGNVIVADCIGCGGC